MKIICDHLQDKILKHDSSLALAGRLLRQIDRAGQMGSANPFQDNRLGIPGKSRENGHSHVLRNEGSGCELTVALKRNIWIDPRQRKIVLDHFCKRISRRKNDEFLGGQIRFRNFCFLCQRVCS